MTLETNALQKQSIQAQKKKIPLRKFFQLTSKRHCRNIQKDPNLRGPDDSWPLGF